MKTLGLTLCAVVIVGGCTQPSGDVATRQEGLNGSARRPRATLVRDQLRSAGVDNPLLIAGIAQAEVRLAHCHFEATWACQGPHSDDCGGPVAAGAGDGPCWAREGGLGMFQFDGGNFDQTLARDGRGVLSLRGNVDRAVVFVVDMLIRSQYVSGVSNRAEAIAWMSDVRVGDAKYHRWIQTVTHYYNGCVPGGCYVYDQRYAHYDTAARTLLGEFGESFWYGEPEPEPTTEPEPEPEPTTEPAPGGGAALALPFRSAVSVQKFMSHRSSSSAWVQHDCSTVGRQRHDGTDFAAPAGTPVVAAAEGTVIRSADGCGSGLFGSRCGGGLGNHVILLHAGGRATLYAHLETGSGIPRVGERLLCGDTVGKSGNSGRSPQPHLYFEVRDGVTGASDYFNQPAVDPFGGRCGTQAASLWATGNPSPICQRGERDDSAFVSATEEGPVEAEAGETIIQRWVVENTGSSTWTPEFGHQLRHTGGDTLGAPSRIDLERPVAPGERVELEIRVTAPSDPGQHRTSYRMHRDDSPFGALLSLELQHREPGNACDSSSLGRPVEDGGCVQVGYETCGLTSCAWFQCRDGGWTCSEAASCDLEDQNPHDSCTGTPDNVCRDEGEVCRTDTDCCNETGTVQCILGFCAETNGCGLLGEPGCTLSSECCGSVICERQVEDGPQACCHRASDPCNSDADCCGAMTCEEGRCAAREVGESCVTGYDCAGAAFCTDAGRCGFE